MASKLTLIPAVIDRDISLFGSMPDSGAVKTSVCKRKSCEEVASVLNRLVLHCAIISVSISVTPYLSHLLCIIRENPHVNQECKAIKNNQTLFTSFI